MKFLIGSEYFSAVDRLISSAVGQIDVAMYHWQPQGRTAKPKVNQLTAALKSAVARGVKCRIILHSGYSGSVLFKTNNAAAQKLRAIGATVKFWRVDHTFHAKFVLVDRKFCALGSHNISNRAMGSNIEISSLVEGSGEIRRVQDYFNLLWSRV